MKKGVIAGFGVTILCAAGYGGLTLLGPSFTLTPATTAPAAPASGVASFAFRPLAIAMPPWEMQIDSAAQFAVGTTFPFLGGNRAVWGCNPSAGIGTTAITSFGDGSTGASGTAATVSFDSTTLLGRTHRHQYNSAAGANSLAGAASGRQMWRGNGAGKGGFHYWASWSPVTATAGQRWMVGLSDAALTTGEPSVLTDSVYFGCDSTDTNLAICSNDNAGSATCNTLGASFPCNTVGAFYNAHLWAAPNASSISWAIERLDSAASAYGDGSNGHAALTSDLPRNTILMVWNLLNNNAATGAASSMQYIGTCHRANP